MGILHSLLAVGRDPEQRRMGKAEKLAGRAKRPRRALGVIRVGGTAPVTFIDAREREEAAAVEAFRQAVDRGLAPLAQAIAAAIEAGQAKLAALLVSQLVENFIHGPGWDALKPSLIAHARVRIRQQARSFAAQVRRQVLANARAERMRQHEEELRAKGTPEREIGGKVAAREGVTHQHANRNKKKRT